MLAKIAMARKLLARNRFSIDEIIEDGPCLIRDAMLS